MTARTRSARPVSINISSFTVPSLKRDTARALDQYRGAAAIALEDISTIYADRDADNRAAHVSRITARLERISELAKLNALSDTGLIINGYSLEIIDPAKSALKISLDNSKLKALAKHTGKRVIGIDLPAQVTCPAADLCASRVDITTRKIVDGPRMVYRCFAAVIEGIYPASANAHYHNLALLQAVNYAGMLELINFAVRDADIIRIHSSGDFFNARYFNAWRGAAMTNSDKIFFGYTKNLPLISDYNRPANMFINYSIGGMFDNLYNANAHYKAPATYVIAPGATTDLPVQVNKYDDYYFILEGVTFAINEH